MRAAISLLLLPLTAACGGSDAQCVIDTDCPVFNRCMAEQCVPVGGGDAAVDTGVPTDSGPPDGSPMDSAADTGTPVLGTGTVALSQTPLPMDAASYAATAAFVRDSATPSGCTTTDGTACTITECVTSPPMDGGVGDAGMGDAGIPTAPHAGAISITGAATAIDLVPGMNGIYPAATGTTMLYTGGETLSFTATGDEVPAFARTLTAPETVNVTSPSVMMGLLSLNRAADLNVTWGATSSATDVIVRLSGFEMPMTGGSRTVSLACTFDGTSGMGTVPAADLGNLPGGGASGSFSVETSVSDQLMAGGWNITVVASALGRGDTGGAATAGTTYP